MANPLTHVAIMKELKKEKPELFNNIDKKYFYSGTVFPDVNYFVRRKAKRNFSFYWHKNKKSTIIFAKKLLKYAKTKKEKSFALGFFSHAIVDKHVHGYINKNKLFKFKHFIAENFLDLEFAYKKKVKTPWLVYPRGLLYKIIIKDNKKLVRYLRFRLFTKIIFFITSEFWRSLIKSRYKKKKKFNFFDSIVKSFSNKHKYKYKINLEKFLHPDFNIKKKHLSNLIKKLEKAKKEFAKEMKKFNY